VLALAAGAIAILLNVGALAAANLIPLATAHGGLLRLLSMITGIAPPGGVAFQTGFHIVVGLAMAVFYGIVLEPLLPGRAWSKGMQYAVALWLANALIILPVTGEGLAGSRDLTLPGMLWLRRLSVTRRTERCSSTRRKHRPANDSLPANSRSCNRRTRAPRAPARAGWGTPRARQPVARSSR